MAKVLQVSVLLLASVLAINAQVPTCPNIIPISGWGARAGRFVPVLSIRPAPFVVVHQTGTAGCTTQMECSAVIRDIQSFQLDGNGWPEISYHFLIGGDNRIYAGRGWGRMGQNVDAFSNQAINVGYIGTFAQNPPTAETQALLNTLIDCGIESRALAANVAVVSQCQVTRIVSCEGSAIHTWIQGHPRFQATPTPV